MTVKTSMPQGLINAAVFSFFFYQCTALSSRTEEFSVSLAAPNAYTTPACHYDWGDDSLMSHHLHNNHWLSGRSIWRGRSLILFTTKLIWSATQEFTIFL